MEPLRDKKQGLNWLLIALIVISAAIHVALFVAIADLYHPKAAPAMGIELETMVSPAMGNGTGRTGTTPHIVPRHRKSTAESHPVKTVHHLKKQVRPPARTASRSEKSPPRQERTSVHAKKAARVKSNSTKVVKALPKHVRPHILQTKIPEVPVTRKSAVKRAIKSPEKAKPSSVAENNGSTGVGPAGAKTRKTATAGIGTRAGAAGAVSAGTGAANVRESYFDKIRRMIERTKHYPLSARQRHLEGRVLLAFTINARGQVSDVRVVKSSRFGMLDDAAMAAVRNASPFPPPPKSLFGDSLDLKIPIAFELVR